MLEAHFNPFPVISTKRLTLRCITQEDANEMFFLRSNEELMKYIDRPRPKSVDEIVPFIQKIIDMITSDEGVAWAITLKGDAKLIGHISFHKLIKEHYRTEVGYILHPAYHGKRYYGRSA